MRVQTPKSNLSDADLAYSALRESGDRVRQLAEHMRDVFWLTAIPPAHFLYLNPAFETVFGRSVDEIYDCAENWIDCIHPDDADSVRARWQDLDGCFEGWDAEFRIVRPGGEIRWVHERAFGITDASSSAFRVGGILEDVTHQKSHEIELAKYQARLLELALRLDDTAEQERRRIAEGMHDDVGQNLALIRLQLGRLRQSVAESDRAVLDETADLVQQTIHATRHLMFELSPPQLYELGYWAAVDWLGTRLLNQAGLELACENECPDVKLNERTTTVLFRVTRELMHNIVKHAETTTARIRQYLSNDQFVVEIHDAGRGFTPPESQRSNESLGLFLSHERIRSIGGELDIDSAPGEGTTVTITLPLGNESSLPDGY